MSCYYYQKQLKFANVTTKTHIIIIMFFSGYISNDDSLGIFFAIEQFELTTIIFFVLEINSKMKKNDLIAVIKLLNIE